MQTVEIWLVVIHSRADDTPSWSRRFVGLPSRRNIQDALYYEHADSHCTWQQRVEVFIDLAARLSLNYATAATRDAYIIRAAHVRIGSVVLRKEAAYIPKD